MSYTRRSQRQDYHHKPFTISEAINGVVWGNTRGPTIGEIIALVCVVGFYTALGVVVLL